MLFYSIAVTVALILILIPFTIIIWRGGYIYKLLVRLGLKENKPRPNWAVFSWNSMLEKLDYNADIVFFGDSITRGGDFQKYYPEKKIVNLGYTGDTLSGMIERISMIKALSPKQIFVLGGINGLTDKNVKMCGATYEKLLDKLIESFPESKIYSQSVLPLSYKKQKTVCKNSTIIELNNMISKCALNRNVTYIDIYSLYEKNGELNPELTVDGMHLHSDAYDMWANVLKEFIK